MNMVEVILIYEVQQQQRLELRTTVKNIHGKNFKKTITERKEHKRKAQ